MTTQSSSTKIRNLILSYNLSQLIVEPTYYTENSSSIIDLILVSKPENVIFSNVTSPFIPNLIRYHCPTVVYLKYRKPVSKTYKRHIWLYNRGHFATFRQKLSQVNWDEIFITNNVYQCAENITESIISAAKLSIPNKTVTIRPFEPQWINSHIKHEIRKRQGLLRKVKQNNTPTHWAKFKQKRNEVTVLIRDAKKQYSNKLIDDLTNADTNSKRWHKVVNKMISPQSTEHSHIPFLEVDDEVIESDHEVVETLNTFFVEQSTLDDSNATLPEFHPPNHELLETIVITDNDVKEAINLLKPNKAHAPDLISPRLYKRRRRATYPYS